MASAAAWEVDQVEALRARSELVVSHCLEYVIPSVHHEAGLRLGSRQHFDPNYFYSQSKANRLRPNGQDQHQFLTR
jgi:hypothetical protein